MAKKEGEENYRKNIRHRPNGERNVRGTRVSSIFSSDSLCTLWQRFELVAKVEDSALTYLRVCEGHRFLS